MTNTDNRMILVIRAGYTEITVEEHPNGMFITTYWDKDNVYKTQREEYTFAIGSTARVAAKELVQGLI